MPYAYRVVAVLLFLGLASAIELAVRRGEAVRWRASLLILAMSCVGALVGVGVDAVTSSISPAYFAVGKGLGWEAGFRGRVLVLGIQAGISGGVVAGCVLAYCNYRKQAPCLPVARVLRMVRYPLVVTAVFAAALGVLAALVPPEGLSEVARSVVDTPSAHRFITAWAVHVGAYLGALVGLVVVVVKVRRARAGLAATG